MTEIVKKKVEYKYYAETAFIPESYLNQQFAIRKNWKRIHRDKIKLPANLNYVYVDGKYLLDKLHYNINATLKNLINEKKKEVCEKDKLVANMSKLGEYKKYIIDAVIVDILDIKNNPNKLASKYKHMFNNSEKAIYIFKPVSGYGGAGIQRFTSFELFQNYVNYIISKWSYLWTVKNLNYYRYWQLQEYIKHPLLLKLPTNTKPYKFHIRLHYIFRPDKQSFYLKRGLMATSELPYIADKWNDKRIHDTHFRGRIGESFPDALKLSQDLLKTIYSQLDEIFTGIDKILRNVGVGCFEESKYCYHLFGADIMIMDDYKVKIIELNDSPGLFYLDNPILPTEQKSIIENIMDLIIDEYFPPLYKPENPYIDDVVYIPTSTQ